MSRIEQGEAEGQQEVSPQWLERKEGGVGRKGLGGAGEQE